MRALALALVLACEPKPTSVVSIPGVDAGPAPAPIAALDGGTTPCAIEVGTPQTLAIPPGLTAIAPQYFHPSGRDGFNDLVQGTKRYRWFDPSDLQTAIDPPGDMEIIVRSTKSFWIGQKDGELRVARRGGREAKRIAQGASLRIVDATEDRLGNAWVIASDSPPRAGGTLWVMRVSPDLSWDQTEPLNLGINVFDAAIAVTDDRTVGVVLLERNENELRVDVWWTGPKHPWSVPHQVDAVTLPPMAVELSIRTTVDLSVAWHGNDELAIAWRPLAPKDGEHVDAGSKGRPPTKPASAEVRIVVARAWAGAIAKPVVHPTVAAALMATTGVGPWPLHSNGMRGATLHRGAVFAWNDDGIVKLAGPADAQPLTIDRGFYRLAFRSSATDLELLLLQSTGPQKVVRLACGP